MRQELTVGRSIGLGVVSGMRSAVAPALVARRRAKGRRGAKLLKWAAIGELLADKAPFAPARTDAPAVAGRVLAATACALALMPGRQPLLKPLAYAGGAALVSTFVMHALRRMSGLPNVTAGLVEDAVAWRLGRRVVG